MYNAQKPDLDDLPSTAQLLRSTAIAFVTAIVILVTVVLPAEYAIDPTGIGRLLGLAEMGEIKNQLAEEAERDRQTSVSPNAETGFLSELAALFIEPAHAQEASEQTAQEWTDEFSFTLTPGQGIEWKLVMEEGAIAQFNWSVDRGRVNYDLHGDGGGESISYQKGRGSAGEAGEITAAFTGNHGWFWRNRYSEDITVTVQLRGQYSEVKQTF